VKTIVP